MRYLNVLLGLLITVSAIGRVNLHAVSYANLDGWQQNDFVKSLQAFKHSCVVLNNKNFKGRLSSVSIEVGESWRMLCDRVVTQSHWSKTSAKRFFEKNFQAFRISSDSRQLGLVTGYYLPEIAGSLKYSKNYPVPIYGRPKNLVSVRLGWFSPKWRNERISGYIINGRLHPYRVSRMQINRGAIKHLSPVLAWVKHRSDRFFLQIQGSGFIRLRSGKRILLGYNGDNGLDYYSIGKWFLKQGVFTEKTISMQAIRQWLRLHPQQAKKVMDLNPAFTFFKVLSSSVPFGTNRIPLTAGYSLAVDSHIVPLGLPLYLSGVKLRRLLITQDTGGAIRGPLRADVYWGGGAKVAKRAGHMHSEMIFYLLLPRDLGGRLHSF